MIHRLSAAATKQLPLGRLQQMTAHLRTMASLPDPIPLVLCGRYAEIGRPVAELLRPEYEVIHFITSIDDAQRDLPHLLAGRDPEPPNANDVGTHNYNKPARVIMFGRGYNKPEEIEKVREICSPIPALPVAWVIADPAKAPTAPPGPGYAEKTAGELKEALAEWRKEGGVTNRVVLY